MKRFTTLALVVFALAAVPAAFADDGSTPSRPAATTETTTTATAAPQDPTVAQQRPDQGNGRPLPNLRHRVHMFVRHCVARTGASPERCLAIAKKMLDRLGNLDDKLQARIAKIQQVCSASDAPDKCKNADKRVDRLTKLDGRVQTVQQKLQDWLAGKGSSSDGEGALDTAATILGSNG